MTCAGEPGACIKIVRIAIESIKVNISIRKSWGSVKFAAEKNRQIVSVAPPPKLAALEWQHNRTG